MHVHHDHSRRIIFAVGLAATLIAALAHHPETQPEVHGGTAHPPAQSAPVN